MSIHDVEEAHGVVQTSLDVAGTSGSCTVQIGDTQSQRLDAALEVRTDRSNEHTELILGSRLDTDNGVAAEHIGTNVQSCTGTVGRNPILVCTDSFDDCFHELIFGENGHLQLTAGICHTGSVQVRTEADDLAILGGISLQAFETGLSILQNAGTFADGDGSLIGQTAFFPCVVLVICDITPFGGHITKTQITPVDIFLCHFNTPHFENFPYSTTQNPCGQYLERKNVRPLCAFVFIRRHLSCLR